MLAAAMGMTAAAQTAPNWDTSGNSMLSGTYYFRHVFWVVGDDYGDLGEGVAVYGNITFTPSTGQYVISGQYTDSAATTQPEPFSMSGGYYISASGYGYIDNEYSSGDEIYGLVSNGIFIGSSTETDYPYNDLYIAAPLASPEPTNATLNGTYTIVGVDNPVVDEEGQADYALDYQLTFTANGAGKIAAVAAATGYIAGNGGSVTSQSIGSIAYTASNGAFQLEFPGTLNGTNLIAGGHYLYVSPDGNFVFGGSPNDWDMFVGVRTSGGNQNFSGLYYEAGMDLDVAALAYGYSAPDSYYGSLVPGTASYLYHQRLSNVFNGAYDYTSDDPLTLNSNGTSSDPYNGQFYTVSANGTYRVGIGTYPFPGIEVAIHAPSLSGSGVYVNPTGIQNGGNFALFTAGIAPGAELLINGSGFSSGDYGNNGGTLPTKLGQTQVLIDGIQAPLVFVTPTLIAAQVPFEIANASVPIVGIQVINGSAQSNVVTLFQNDTQPGVWTTTQNGLGAGAVYHSATFQPVTSANPAVAGETLAVYLNGLGTVTPQIADGVPAPSTELVNTNFPIFADLVDPVSGYLFPVGVSTTLCSNQDSADGIFGAGCPVAFSGLAPSYAALYQANFVMPSTDGYGDALTSGNLYLELQGLDSSGTYVESYTSQATVAVSGATATATQPVSVVVKPANRSRRPAIRTRSLRTHQHGRVVPRQLPGELSK